MGLGGISIWQLLIILVIVLLLFGTKKLRGIGTDLGGAVKGFKDSMTDKESGKESGKESVGKEPDSETDASAIKGEETSTAKTSEETDKAAH